MISTSNLSLSFGGRKLFEEVNIRFVPGNCYGLIGANGAGKSTFLKILSGEITTFKGEITISPGERIAVLKQDHFQFDDVAVLKTVMMGHTKLNAVMEEREMLYAKEDFSEADGDRSADLEAMFQDLNGWEAEAEAGTLLAGLGIGSELQTKKMKELTGSEKIKVLLAQALFGDPDILLLDEPTNNLDPKAILWLEDFLYDFKKTVIVVSHDRHFLNKVCTHMADLDFNKIQLFTGNYDFWYESSQLALRMQQEQRKKTEEKVAELRTFIERFSANASKSRQATSRQKQLGKLTLDDIKPSSRKYPFLGFKPEREAGNNILEVKDLCLTVEGQKVLNKVSFLVNKNDKVIFVGQNDVAISSLFEILAGQIEPESGDVDWGVTVTHTYYPKDNTKYFAGTGMNLIEWLRQFSEDKSENFLRSFLGRMLFSGEEALKSTEVLSGGERARCMYAKMMLTNANLLMLDGPTNHLDLESITAVNNSLIRFNGTILFSSHDHQFAQTVATRVIEITANGAVDHQIGYDEYISK